MNSYTQLKAGEEKALESASTEQVGIGGFTFYASINESVAYETDSPTSTVEDGSYAGDHLINAPIKINISGDVADIFIAEAVQSKSEARLPTVGTTESFKPQWTNPQLQKIRDIIDSLDDRKREISEQMNGGTKAAQFSGSTASGKSYQEQFLDFIESIHYGKQLVAISTAYRKHESMAINSVTIVRDNQRNALSFSLVAQKVRISKTLFADASKFYKKPAPSVKSQTAGTSDKGAQEPESGKKKQKSLLSAITGR